MPDTIPVPADVFRALGAYLVTRPFNEVATLIGRLNEAAHMAMAQHAQAVTGQPEGA